MKVGIIFDRINDLAVILAGILVIFVMLSVSADVVSSYFLRRPIEWVLEISEYMLLYIPFLVVAWVLKREGHVKVDILLNRLDPRTQSLLNVVISFIGAVVCFILAWYGVTTTWHLFQFGVTMPTPLRVPKFIIVAVIPVGFFFTFIQFLRRAWGYLGSWRTS
jgi:TRAP-type C4-dicarboxylate transport system permease small subunit